MHKKIRILGIGLHGLVGSRIVELLQDDFEFESFSRSSGVDITKPETLHPITQSSAACVLLLSAKTDVDGCEQDKPLGESGEAWHINVSGVQHVVEACKQSQKKILYISTDFVFDGEKDSYTELDQPNPINWYGYTKYRGEQVVQSSGIPFAILRIAYPFRKSFEAKKDFVRAIVSRLQAQQPIQAITDHTMTPTYIDDIAQAFSLIVQTQSEGIFHVVGSQSLTPFDASQLIAQQFNLDTRLIQPTTRAEFFKNRAPRPFHLSLKNDKITRLGIAMKSFQEGLSQIR